MSHLIFSSYWQLIINSFNSLLIKAMLFYFYSRYLLHVQNWITGNVLFLLKLFILLYSDIYNPTLIYRIFVLFKIEINDS